MELVHSLLFSGGGSGFFSSLLKGTLGVLSCEQVELGMGIANAPNISSLLELSKETTSNRSVDLKLFAEDTAGDAEDLGHLLGDLIESLLFKENLVVKLVLYLNLGPCLLLCFSSLCFLGLRRLSGAFALVSSTLLRFGLRVNKQRERG